MTSAGWASAPTARCIAAGRAQRGSPATILRLLHRRPARWPRRRGPHLGVGVQPSGRECGHISQLECLYRHRRLRLRQPGRLSRDREAGQARDLSRVVGYGANVHSHPPRHGCAKHRRHAQGAVRADASILRSAPTRRADAAARIRTQMIGTAPRSRRESGTPKVCRGSPTRLPGTPGPASSRLGGHPGLGTPVGGGRRQIATGWRGW
jgi:hypothetical protein